MRTIRDLRLPLLALALLAGVAAAPRPAAAVTVTMGSTSGLAGQTVDLAINTTDVTGLGVMSYQFALNYNANVVTAVNVNTSGTLTGTAGWATPTFSVTSGRVAVSAAGATALSGAGTLVKVSFLINPAQLNGTSIAVTFQSGTFIMNEGTPPVTTSGNGTITVTATPQITVSPNQGEIARTQTLQFSVSGSVTNPVSWFTTDNSIATISGSGLLTGVAPGSVLVYAVDNAGRRDTTDNAILIRGMTLGIGSASVVVGQNVTVPVNVSSLNGLGVRSGQFTVSYATQYLSFVSASAPSGTLLNGYGSMNAGASNGVASVDFAGTTDLTGSGVLCYLTFSALQPAGVTLALTTALFNETLPALRSNGVININSLPTIGVSPNTATLLAGQTQNFTVTGSPSLPVTWSVLDPTVGSITSGGVFTAIAGGVTQVKVVDNVGAIGLSGNITVYDCKLTVGTVTTSPGATATVPLTLDRTVGGLGIYSVQYRLDYTPTWVTGIHPFAGLMSVWGNPTFNPQSGSLRLASAGNQPLGNGGVTLEFVGFDISASAPVPTDIPVTLNAFLFNEGKPIPQIVNGTIRIRSSVDVEGRVPLALSLGPIEPNPASADTRIALAFPSGGTTARLAVYGLDGRRVRVLLDRDVAAGERAVSWDATNDAGQRVGPGIYFVRLEWGAQHLQRKLAILR
jgi:hypothetical protein